MCFWGSWRRSPVADSSNCKSSAKTVTDLAQATFAHTQIFKESPLTFSLVTELARHQELSPLLQDIRIPAKNFDRYGALFRPLFGPAPSIRLARHHVIGEFRRNVDRGCLYALCWGFPRGRRPGGVRLAAADPKQLAFFGVMIRAMRKYGLTARRYDTINSLRGTANGVTTKFMYFGEVKTKAGQPALIFDSRVHNYIQFHRPVEFSALLSTMPKYRSTPTGKEYLVFLEAVSEIAATANWRPDAVEMFMFLNSPNKRAPAHQARSAAGLSPYNTRWASI
jgi:hypothetical protein